MKRGPGAQQSHLQQKNEGTAKYYKAPYLQLSPRMNCKWQNAVLGAREQSELTIGYILATKGFWAAKGAKHPWYH